MKQFKFKINGNEYQADITSVADEKITVEINGVSYNVAIEKEKKKTPILTVPKVINTTLADNKKTARPGTSNPGTVTAPIPGSIIKIKCKVGDPVNLGDTVILLEAMKMQNEIQATASGTVKEIFVKEGDAVMEGTDLISINS
jgi:glutaconyl-CoA/methylmalonyl-CoA decarboxylase subunit gamma